MNDPLPSLEPSELRAIASGLKSGRLRAPYSAVAIQRFVSNDEADRVATSLCRLATSGISASAISELLELLAVAIERRPAFEDLVDIVTTGPEVAGISNRDTSAVVGDLFRRAERSVLAVGYAVYQGQELFLDLADRMQAHPELHVRMYLDIKREIGDTSSPEEIVRRFVHRFRTTQWPLERRLPEIYFDPRALSIHERAALHAKCVVVDHREAFVSSANFTYAAQARNIELGLLMHSPNLALRIEAFFEGLVSACVLNRAI